MKCYLCNNDVSPYLSKNGYQLMRCLSCGLLFYDFKKNYSEFLDKQYSKGYFTGQSDLRSYVDYGRDKGNIKKNMEWYVNEIKQYKTGGTFLDVGCAYGYAMEEAHEKGFDVYGIDPSTYAISQAKKKFPKKVQVMFLSQIKFKPDFFDVVTLFDVFEHLQNPRKDLQKIKKILKKDGLLVIATGDAGSLWSKITGRKWTFYNPPQHIFYFNRNNITSLLNEQGFSVLTIKTTGKWLSASYVLHLAETVGESSFARFISPLVHNTILGRIPFYLKLDDNMVVFARKR